MKKLNRKGYMTIEVVISSVIAFTVAFFLMELTMKLVNTVDDTYVDTQLITDKALIMKNIKESINMDINNKGNIEDLSTVLNGYNIRFGNGESRSLLLVDKNDGSKEIVYKDNSSPSIYSKKLNSNLSNVSLSGSINGDYIFFKITGNNIFSDKDYSINIIVHK